MKKIAGAAIIMLMIFSSFTGCKGKAVNETENDESSEESAQVDENELYILVSALSTYDMFKSNDFAAFEQWGEDYGVKTQIVGPADWDMAAMAAAIDQAAAQNPAGLLVGGFDPTLKPAIDNAIEQGIPVVTYDADVPESKRLAFSGTNWSEIGRHQALALGEAIGGKGKVAYMGVVGMGIMEQAFAAFEETMKEQYPNVELLEKFNNQEGVESAAATAADIISAHPDLSGFAAFNSFSGPGIGIALREAGKIGEIKLTAVDMEPQHLKLIQDGIATMLVGQKRKLFTYWGAAMLYNYAHKKISFSEDDRAAGISWIPAKIDTGLIIVTKDNIEYFIK